MNRFHLYLLVGVLELITFDQMALANSSSYKICQASVEVTRIKEVPVVGDEVVENLNNKGTLLLNQGNPHGAEAIFQEALSEMKKNESTSPLLQATVFNGLGLSFFQQRKFADAEHAYLQAKQKIDEAHSDDNQLKAIILDDLAQAFRLQHKFELAEPCYQQALSMEEKLLGPNNQDTAITKCNLGMLYREEEKYDQAEQYLTEGMSVLRKTIGGSSPGYLGLIPYYKAVLKATGHKSQFPEIAE